MKKISKEKLFVVIILMFSIISLFFLFKNLFISIIKYQLNDNVDGMNSYLKEVGILGPVLIVLMEAIQMICVFISVEFLQVATGLSYPWYMAVILCEIGVILGSTIIYSLVNLFKFDSSIFGTETEKIEDTYNQNKPFKMFLFFLSPLIPTGFVCYYGAKKKVKFKTYLFICAIGALPDILIATFLGHAIRYFILNKLSGWVLILFIIIGYIILWFFARFLSKILKITPRKKTPRSRVFLFMLYLFKILSKNKPKIDKSASIELEGPFIILSNHPSFFDGYYLTQTVYPIRPAFVLNRYYFKDVKGRFIFNRMGVIPKKLFSPDVETIKKAIRTIKSGYSIYMCPEGRLSVDGTNYLVNFETAKFIKQMKVPVIMVRINGAYLASPKWRKNQYKTTVSTEISRVISKEELLEKTPEQLSQIINEAIKFNDFEYARKEGLVFKSDNKACGLENILYYCPECGAIHQMTTHGNCISCKNCDFKLFINEDYWFEENKYNISNIHEYYELIKRYERENIKNGLNLKTEVTVKKYNFNNSKLNEIGKGVCYLSNEGFTFEGDLKVGKFSHTFKTLHGLAFTAGEEFECYYENELYYFYPVKDKSLCAQWALIVDEMQNGGDNHEGK